MTQAIVGNIVRVHYAGRLSDGSEFDSSTNREPLEITLGDSRVIPAFEQAIVGMAAGEKKTITIEADNAYGPHRPDMVVQVEKDQLPPDLDPKQGDQLELSQGEQVYPVQVTAVSDSSVTLDANHPLAGQDLTFNIELVEIV